MVFIIVGLYGFKQQREMDFKRRLTPGSSCPQADQSLEALMAKVVSPFIISQDLGKDTRPLSEDHKVVGG